MDDKHTFDFEGMGRRLKEIRLHLGLKQKPFANSLNTSVTTLSDTETGKKRPGFEMLFLVSKVYNVNLHYLLYGEGNLFRPGEEPEIKDESVFREYTGDVNELLWYFKHSRLTLNAVMAMAKEYIYKNETMIQKDIQSTKKKIEGDLK
ncbi:MAG: helix-turn-helix transcriptional regulator [bacterium]|nr:helix-turn-helix transcriptional regulator [bacterium]